MKKLLLLTIVVLGFSAISFGQAKTADATASATLVSGINFSNPGGTSLSFGNIVAGVAGTVTITATGTGATRTPVGVTVLTQGGYSAAQFKVTGTKDYTYTITNPGDLTISTATGTNKDMVVSGWNATVVTGDGTLNTIPTSGEQRFNYGGVLTLEADQAVGVYTGTFTVTVNYN